jgi:hypothetical protein
MLKIRFYPPTNTETLEQAEQTFRRLFAGSEVPQRSGTRYITGVAVEYQLNYQPKRSRSGECMTIVSDAPDITHAKDGKHITVQEREQIYNAFNHNIHKRRCQCCNTDQSDFNVEWHDLENRSVGDFFSCCYVCVEKWMPNT